MTSATETTPILAPTQSLSTDRPKKLYLGYKEALKQWWTQPSHEEAEDSVFNLVKDLPADRSVQHTKTKISVKATVTGGKEFEQNRVYDINEYSIKSKRDTTTNEQNYTHSIDDNLSKHAPRQKNLVILHGYGAGLGFFFKNFGPLARGLGACWDIYALDWLGYGGSSRPDFKIQTSDLTKTRQVAYTSPLDPTGQQQNVLTEVLAVREAEDWFVESLEAWRQTKKIEKLVLMGHSMGGYLATVYAMRYPNHVENLVLVSPAGVEYGYDPRLDNQCSFTQSVLGIGNNEHCLNDIDDEKKSAHSLQQRVEKEHGPWSNHWRSAHERRKQFGSTMAYLWNLHISPFSILRFLNFLGPRLVSYWTLNRFKNCSGEEIQAMHTYSYKTFSGKGSGEYAISRLLGPGIMPRMPLLDRVGPRFGLLKCPSLWMYGSRDWMDSSAGQDAVGCLNALDAQVEKIRTKHDMKEVSRKAQYVKVPHAGHHLYMDNPKVFNDTVVEYLLKE